MNARFKYETPNVFLKAALTLTTPRRWRSRARPWIFDNVTGVRFQPSEDEDALLSQLSGPTDTAFERVVLAIMDKRRGYVCDWHRVSRGLASGEER
jgi:hypothetical protein